MEKLTLLFEEFLQKAMLMTETFIAGEFTVDTNFEGFTSNRERLFAIMDQISEQITWDDVPNEKRAELNRQVEYIKKLDDQLLVKLEAYQQEVRREIEQTVKQKDNIKGYNLTDVK
jgi:hypothetical protein